MYALILAGGSGTRLCRSAGQYRNNISLSVPTKEPSAKSSQVDAADSAG